MLYIISKLYLIENVADILLSVFKEFTFDLMSNVMAERTLPYSFFRSSIAR